MNRTLATSLTATLFLVIGLSGVMMYFHFFNSYVKNLHEILGLAFVVAVIFHVFYNFKSMQKYFTKKIFLIICLLTVIVSTAFIIQSANKGENPKSILIQKVLKAPIKDSILLLTGNYENAIIKLEKNGIKISEGKSIEEVAKSNGINPFKIVNMITAKE